MADDQHGYEALPKETDLMTKKSKRLYESVFSVEILQIKMLT
jgi:hypothetical protein